MFVTRVRGSLLIVAQRSGVTIAQWARLGGGVGRASRSERTRTRRLVVVVG